MTVSADRPFFILGSDRSGTTMFRLMLNAHPRLCVPRESWFITDLLNALPAGAPLTADQVELARQCLRRHWRWHTWDIPDASLVEATDRLHEPTLAQLVDAIFRIPCASRAKPRWGDKTPGYLTQIHSLHRLFPAAQFLHVIRDCRDVCISLRRVGWRGPGLFHAAQYWNSVVASALLAGRTLPAGQYLEIHYDDLVLRTEAVLRRTCEFLREDYAPCMRDYYKTAADELADFEKHANIHAKVSRLPQADDVDRWRRELSAREVMLIEALAGPTMDRVGQARHFGRWSRPVVGGIGVAARGLMGARRRLAVMGKGLK